MARGSIRRWKGTHVIWTYPKRYTRPSHICSNVLFGGGGGGCVRSCGGGAGGGGALALGGGGGAVTMQEEEERAAAEVKSVCAATVTIYARAMTAWKEAKVGDMAEAAHVHVHSRARVHGHQPDSAVQSVSASLPVV